MAASRTCAKCGATLNAGSALDVCPQCVAAQILSPTGVEQTDSAALVPVTEQPGDRIGRYKLREKVGEGGCGVVYVAEQEEPVRRRVALKVIKLGMDTRSVVARFEAERQALAMMDHTNIARVLDAGTTDTGRPYFVMELVRGIRITDYCDENKLDTQRRLDLFIQVCHAVQHAHQKGIIHRDLKPSNILVTINDGVPVPKVIDFGIAKATEGRLTDKTIYTQLHQFIGTPAYMSPEQAMMTSLDIDTRSDIYSLGVLLYELLTGRPPFDPRAMLAAGIDEVRRTIREQEPPRPSTRLSTLPQDDLTTAAKRRSTEAPKLIHSVSGDLDWIVMKCLEKDRTRRYETANGLAADIQRHLSNEAVLACPPSAAYRLQKAWRRNKVAMSAGAAFAGVMIIATGVSSWQAIRASRAEALAAQRWSQSEQAREEAEAISKFLSAVFRSPRPEKGQRTITVAESLDAAAEKLEKDPSISPARRSRLQATIGRTYDELGLYREAIGLLEKVLAHRRAVLGSEHRDTLDTMNNLAVSYYGAGRREEAHKLREELLTVRRKVLGSEHPDTLGAMFNVASFSRAGREKEALKMLEELLPLHRKVLGPKHRDTLSVMHNLALSYSDAGRREEALKLQEEVLPLSREVRGPEHPSTLKAMHNLAGSYFDAGRPEEALKLREEVLPLYRKVLGPEHPDTLGAMNNLAFSYFDVGRREEALKLREETLPLSRKVLGPEHPDTLNAMNNLAFSYFSAGRRGEALKLREEALALCRKVSGPEHSMMRAAIGALADSYYDAGRKEEAIKLREEVLMLRRQVRGLEHPSTLNAMFHLADSYVDAGRREEALKLREEALPLARKVLGPEHTLMRAVMTDVADSYKDAERFAEAEALYRELVEYRRKYKTKGQTSLAQSLASLGECHLRQGKSALAEPYLREALPVLEEKEPEQSGTFVTQSLLGASLVGQQQYATAEPILLKAFERLKKRDEQKPSPSHAKPIREAGERIVQLYEAWGKPEQAAEWRKKLSAAEPIPSPE